MRFRALAYLAVLLLTGISSQANAQAAITGISPGVVQAGGQVTITGTGFGASQGLANSISFAGTPASPRVVASSWTATRITVTVPASAISGNVTVTVSGKVSNVVGLTVTPM